MLTNYTASQAVAAALSRLPSGFKVRVRNLKGHSTIEVVRPNQLRLLLWTVPYEEVIGIYQPETDTLVVLRRGFEHELDKFQLVSTFLQCHRGSGLIDYHRNLAAAIAYKILEGEADSVVQVVEMNNNRHHEPTIFVVETQTGRILKITFNVGMLSAYDTIVEEANQPKRYFTYGTAREAAY